MAPIIKVATDLHNLATFYDTQRKYAEAEPLLQRALAIRQRMLGPEHPMTAVSTHELAVLYDSQEKYLEAESLLKDALAIIERAWVRSTRYRYDFQRPGSTLLKPGEVCRGGATLKACSCHQGANTGPGAS